MAEVNIVDFRVPAYIGSTITSWHVSTPVAEMWRNSSLLHTTTVVLNAVCLNRIGVT